ncbi:exonuclease [Bacillus toyonensis]|uniref:exonuclease n=1 Tax=Bacillus toyonensis TaxID=155322 RepID=UPI000B444BDC|nr:exonuclease [Bacillus toyonensis]OTX42952.1 exonuclease [Bacillus thuringiensis serovar malayensis]OUB03776.1 exonuclease [Bacillus thuringiensis serovar shandongiensis]MBX0353914.1 exonuclease [Bacillus toyonensis]MDM5257753.1 exonuclease [Bacillus toyonensis]MEC2391297.1 exonuclease [Bacillus toyonensis]
MKNATRFIVFDIERNFRPYKSEDPSEIVDIGAVKIDVSTMKVIGEFSELVKPSAPLTRHTTKLTGITKKDLIGVEKFPQIIEKFIQFIGEDSVFISWGKEDYHFLSHDCTLHGLECPCMEKDSRFDLQKFVFQAYEELFEHTPSLQSAVEQLGLTWEGKQHRALADAENTANILLKIYSERDINKRYKRHGELELVKNGKLTEKAKKKMRKWVFKELKKHAERPFVWSTFESSETWESITERYYISENKVELLKKHFPTAVRKAERQLKYLAEMEENAQSR